MSPVSPVFNTVVTVSIGLNKASFQIGVSDLVQLKTKGRHRHTSGPGHFQRVCYIYYPFIDA